MLPHPPPNSYTAGLYYPQLLLPSIIKMAKCSMPLSFSSAFLFILQVATSTLAGEFTTVKDGHRNKDSALYKRSNNPITNWNGPPSYNSYTPPAIPMHDIYGQNVYHPPPMPNQRHPTELDGVYAPSFEEDQETQDEKRKRRAQKKISRRMLRGPSRLLDQGDVPAAPGEVVGGEYGYDTNGPGSPMVCGPDADRTYGAYGGGHSTNPLSNNGFNPPTPASYKQPVSTDPNADFSKAKPCGPGDGYGPYLGDYHNVLGDNGAGSTPTFNPSSGGAGGGVPATMNNPYGMGSGGHMPQGHSTSAVGPVIGGLAGAGLVAGGAYMGYRHCVKKMGKSSDQSYPHDHSGDYDYDTQSEYGQSSEMHNYEREGTEQYHDAEMYGYGQGQGHGYHRK